MKAAPRSLKIPRDTPLTDESGNLNRQWDEYHRDMRDRVEAMGVEKSFELTNNQASAANIEGLYFDCKSVSQATVDYLIQRITTGGGAQEKVEGGHFYLVYLPTSDSWSLSNGPSTAGITLSVTSAGQVQYTSTNLTGAASISKITFKARTLAAKNSQYSQVGR